MEHAPNSGPEKGENYFKQQSSDIGPHNGNDDEQSLPQIEYITVHNTTKIWEGPRYPAYNSKAALLESYTGWPHGINPSPSSLSTAGFYFLGKRLVIEKIFENTIHFNIITHTQIPLYLSFSKGDLTRCFHCGGLLYAWRTTDEPFAEHARWYPNCVFVRYIKGEEFIRDCQKSHKACTLM